MSSIGERVKRRSSTLEKEKRTPITKRRPEKQLKTKRKPAKQLKTIKDKHTVPKNQSSKKTTCSKFSDFQFLICC